MDKTLNQELIKVKFQPVHFSDQEISMFNSVSGKDIISVATDTSIPDSPLWVNFVILNYFAKLHLHYWNRAIYANTPLAIEQRSVINNILFKSTHVFNLAVRHCCVLSQWVDLRALLKATINTKMENVYLAKYPHNEYDILEIEKTSLEQSKIEQRHDIIDEAMIKDLIILSKFMALTLHGIHIL